MNLNQRCWLTAVMIACLTVATGFLVWWTFLPIAFASAFYLTRTHKTWRVVLISGVSPAVGWLVTALARDLSESLRISHKLAGLLHVHYGVVIYLALFIVCAVPSCLAAFSGSETSKAFR